MSDIPKIKKKRKLWYRVLKNIMKIRYKKPAFVYLGEEFDFGSLILSNHEGTDAPMAMEIYNSHPTRIWGANEMNSGLVKMYKYQTRVYYHEKKHWNLHLARLFCLLASPLTNLFYKGLNLISTYKDARLLGTIKESIKTLKRGESVVIYPENSEKGYLEKLEGLHNGFILLGESCLRQKFDVKVYLTYYRKKDNVYIVDKPILYSELSKDKDKSQIAKQVLDRINEIGQMTFDEEYILKLKQQKN